MSIFSVSICLIWLSLASIFFLGTLPVFAQGDDAEMSLVLDGTAAYCEKLKNEVCRFFCYETVVETVNYRFLYPREQSGLKKFFDDYKSGYQQNQEKRELLNNRRSVVRKSRKEYVNEYRILKLSDRITEDRVRVKDLRKSQKDQPIGSSAVIYSFQNALHPIYLFSKENQHKYIYHIKKKKTVLSRRAFLIEIRSKSASESSAVDIKENSEADRHSLDSSLLVEAAVDAEDFSILMFQVHPAAFHGYSHLISADTHDFSDIRVKDTHYFGVKHGGVRFPSKTDILLTYKQKAKKKYNAGKRLPYGMELATDLQTTFFYDKYIFYKVQMKISEIK